MITLLQGLVMIAAITAGSCMAVRWVLPTALRLAEVLLVDGVALVGACLLLPEFWLSSRTRRRKGRPPRVAYEYSDAVAGSCVAVQLSLRIAARGLASAARRVPLPLVAVTAGATYVAPLLV